MGRSGQTQARTAAPVRAGAPPFELVRFLAVYAEPVAGLMLRQGFDPAVTATEDTVVLAMTVHNPSGDKVGEVSRTFRRTDDGRSFARLSGIRLDREWQGGGFGRALHEREAQQFAAFGFDELSMEAAWHGAAFWPQLGFEPLYRDDEAAAAVLDQVRHVLDFEGGDWCKGRGDLLLLDLAAQHRISSNDAEELERLVRDPSVPFSVIAGYGRERSWRTADGRELWPGRALLAGARYEAVKQLR